MAPKKSASERKTLNSNTDSVFDTSANSPTNSTSSERKKTAALRESTQGRLAFDKLATKSVSNDSVMDKLECLQSLITESKLSLERKLEEKTDFLNAALFELQKENASLKKMLEESQKERGELKKEIKELNATADEQKERINELEQYTRRESIRIHGLKGDSKDEKNQDCEKKVLQIFHDQLNLETIDSADISAIHRVGKFNGLDRPRSVIVKFVSRKTRDEVVRQRRKLKGTKIVIAEDLTHLNLQRLNRTRQMDNVVNAWTTAGGRLFAKLQNGAIKEVVRGDTSCLRFTKRA